MIISCSFQGNAYFQWINSEPLNELCDPKTSAEEITIETPENKTYTEPDKGYYPGTYGFENDANGAIPAEWEDNIHTYASVQVIEELGGHKKVLECYSGSQTDSYLHMNNYFEPQTDGILEWWWRKSSTQSSAAFFMLYNQAGDDMIQIGMDTANDPNTIFYSGATSEIDTGAPYSDDTWIHIRIAFDCTVDRWSLWVDGGLYLNNIDFKLGRTTDTVNRAMFWCYDGGHPTLYYVDAFSYSWDPDYNVGENLHEGLLLSYDNTTTLDWQGYSLDGASNKTILGNTTIPMPTNGRHQIQVFGNNSLGENFQSNLRYFTIDKAESINIVTPEEKIYVNPNSGYYPGTYGFENDPNGALPAEWEDNIHTYASVQVIEELGGHKKVLECYSGSQTDSYLHMNNYFEPQTDGIIEWWWRKSSTQSSAAFFMLYNSIGEDMIQIGMDTSNDPNTIFYSGATSEIDTGAPYSDDTWIHIRIAFDCAVDRWSLWVDGGLYLDNIDFKLGRTTDTVNRAMFWCYDGGHPTLYYVDAFSYSWDPDYNVGDNLHEGLLLSYDSTTTLDWQGYSLDGASNKTILGNTTIPMPKDGQHQIQVFGNDSVGNMYASEIRYFETNIVPADINIISPINNELLQDIAPNFEIFIGDPDLNSTWYSLDGITNIPFSGFTGTIDQTEWNKFSNGTVTIGFYANDSANNISYESVIVRKDVLGPILTVIYPQMDEVFGFDSPNYNLSIVEHNLDSIWYSYDYGANEVPLYSLTGTLNQVEWDSIDAGTVPIRFYANDSLGHESFIDIIIIKDLTAPIININSPSSFDIFGEISPEYDISITEPYLDSYWYTMDGGINNVSISSLTGNISQAEWDKFGNGTITIVFYAADEAGNKGYKTITLRKDINIPIINIISPQFGDILGYEPLNFELSVVEPNIDTMWYTLDGGLTNYTFTQLTGQIDGDEWSKHGHGSVLIRFYVKDQSGNLAYSEIEVEKDLVVPIITINSPQFGTVYSDLSPLYDIRIDEDNLDSYWYSFDGGATNHSISELNGAILDSAWDALPNGHVTLTFYALDKAGNIGHKSVIITKQVETPTPPAIPGYDLYLLISVLSIAVLILIKARKYKI